MIRKFTLVIALGVTAWSGSTRALSVGDKEPVGPIIELAGHTGAVLCIAFSPNGKFAATHGGLGDGSFHLWDVDKRLEVGKRANDDCGGLSVAWAEGGLKMGGGGGGGRGYGSVILQNPFNGERASDVIRHELVVRAVAMSPDGKRFAAADSEGLVVIRHFKGGAKVRTFAHGTPVNSIAYSSDGQLILSGSDDKKLRLWNMDKGLERVFEGHQGIIGRVAFSREGKQGYSASFAGNGDTDNTIRIWDLQSGKQIAKLDVGGEGRQLWTAAFSADGRRALTGHDNGEVCLWDLATQKKLASYRQHKHAISSVAFSPDGRLALSGENNQGGSAMWLYRLP